MTESRDLHEMSRAVGGLQNAVEFMTDLWKSQEIAATEGRRQLHIKFDTLKDEVRTLAGRVDQMGKDISLIQPSIKSFNDETLREEGAKRLGLKIWAALITAAGFLGWALHGVVSQAWDWLLHIGR